MKQRILLFILLLLGLHGLGQDINAVRNWIDSLCAPGFHGRGYVAEGDVKAAQFLVRNCKTLGLEPLGDSYLQPFTLGVNTFPGAMTLKLNDHLLVPGQDYIIEPRSIAQMGTFEAFYLKKKHCKSGEKLFKLSEKQKINESVVIVDTRTDDAAYQDVISRLNENPLRAKSYLVLTDKKLTWAVGRSMINSTIMQVKAEAFKPKTKTVHIEVDQTWEAEYETYNVMAQIKGTSNKTIVFTAHYDHLGRMGADTYIPGASDNASGTAMLLDLAKYYKANPPKYNVIFLWFAGEEAGLVGSKYFVNNPAFDLNEIDFLINLDLMADAKKGITVVNGKIFEDAFSRLTLLNDGLQLLPEVKARGAAANSDHFPFYEKGIPSFFIYTVGDYQHYHDVEDKPENIPLTNYNEVFELILRFTEATVR